MKKPTLTEKLVTAPWVLQLPALMWLIGGLYWVVVFGYWQWTGDCIATVNTDYWCSFSGPIDWWYRGSYLAKGKIWTILGTILTVGTFLAVLVAYVDGLFRILHPSMKGKKKNKP